VVLVLLVLQTTGLLAIERHRGYAGAIWSADGNALYYLERDTRGVIAGMGWEFFSPPAQVRVLSDTLTLHRLDLASDRDQALYHLDVTPHIDRVISRYRSRIFGLVRTAIAPGPPLALAVAISIPVQSYSENWVYRAASSASGFTTDGWRQEPTAGITPGEAVLVNDRELMLVRGPEGYGEAILAQDSNGGIEVLRSRPGFRLADISLEALAKRSRRASIERVRHLRATRAELVERYRGEGMLEGEASLAAYDSMQEMGLLPPDPHRRCSPHAGPAAQRTGLCDPFRILQGGAVPRHCSGHRRARRGGGDQHRRLPQIRRRRRRCALARVAA
jgi:hypothetical protein